MRLRTSIYNAVRNISSKPLTETQTKVLQKGLNFNTGHDKRDILNTVAALDEKIDSTN